MMDGASKADEKRWKAESDLRTLIDAEKIKADKARFKAAMDMADEQKKALGKVLEK